MRGDGDVNHVIVKAAKENGVRIEFDLSGVLRAEGGERVQALRGLRKLRELVEYYDAPFVVSADPTSHLELRAPGNCSPSARRSGSTASRSARVSRWGVLAERNRELLSEEFIAPGVEVADDEEDA